MEKQSVMTDMIITYNGKTPTMTYITKRCIISLRSHHFQALPLTGKYNQI